MKKQTKTAGSMAVAPVLTKAFSSRLKAWRTDNELTLKTVAEGTGVSTSIVCEWEHGTRFPSAEHLETLAKFMGTPACCLVYDGRGACSRVTYKRKA